jgi:hypothetical protein
MKSQKWLRPNLESEKRKADRRRAAREADPRYTVAKLDELRQKKSLDRPIGQPYTRGYAPVPEDRPRLLARPLEAMYSSPVARPRPRSRPRRYFGMSGYQLAILLVMAMANLLLLLVGCIMIFMYR